MKGGEKKKSVFSSSSFESSFGDAIMKKRGWKWRLLWSTPFCRTANKTEILELYTGRRRREMEKAISASS